MSAPTPTGPEARFWSMVDRRGEDECWPWRGHVHRRTGVPQLAFEGRTETAARVAWSILKGTPPKKLHRTCFNITCVNPHHGSARAPRYRRDAR